MDSLTELALHAKSALYGRAGPVTFANRGKSNQKRLPLHPASSCGARNGRDVSTSHESFAVATHNVCRRHVYDRPLLRSSARAEGATSNQRASTHRTRYIDTQGRRSFNMRNNLTRKSLSSKSPVHHKLSSEQKTSTAVKIRSNASSVSKFHRNIRLSARCSRMKSKNRRSNSSPDSNPLRNG